MKKLCESKPSKTQESIDIILQDEEMNELIRKLVEKAEAKGACITHLQKATQIVWNDISMKANTEITYSLSPSQKDFEKKVEAFIAHFSEDLVHHHDKTTAYSKIKSGNVEDERRKIRFLNSTKVILSSMYIVFEKEDSVTQQLVKLYSRNYFDYQFRGSITNELRIIRTFLKEQLYVENNSTDSLPKYSPDYLRYDLRWLHRDDFNEFTSHYRYASESACETALLAIWFINKFF